ncbi:hypothetical protein FE257_002717 [Aspergillus nanangensis]|uniref:Uncharacterized protein n=1 Tax=Aspergillus nanangensis TaxID=2582783 RepID=A0AAD4GN76_ASPNN|nr:hypothetical protein FE257_002717 [Aspergillus nanangensis]
MFPLRPINLPPPVLLTGGPILGLGLYLSVFRVFPSVTLGSREKKLDIFVPRPVTPRVADTNALFGLVASALMLPYFVSSYMPVEENQFLHASVPIRLALAVGLGGNVLLRGRKGMSEEGFWEFVALAVLDGVGAVWLGFYLGRFDGMVPTLK